jgi:hypothetical protein
MPPVSSSANVSHGSSLLPGTRGQFPIGASSLPTQNLSGNVSSGSNAANTQPDFTQLLSTAQAQQAALLQTLIGSSAGPSQNPTPYHTTIPSTNPTHPLGFTPEQQAYIDMTTQLAVSKALAAQSQASMPTPVNPRPPSFPPLV